MAANGPLPQLRLFRDQTVSEPFAMKTILQRLEFERLEVKMEIKVMMKKITSELSCAELVLVKVQFHIS